MAGKYQQGQDEAQIRALILREWSRERIVRFATHLMGDKCQLCVVEQQNKSLQHRLQNQPPSGDDAAWQEAERLSQEQHAIDGDPYEYDQPGYPRE